MTVAEETPNGVSVEENLGLVRACARRYTGRGIEYDDLYGAGCVGLCKAVGAFDASRGYAFSTYAVPVILGEIKRLFRDDGTVSVSRRLKELSLRAADEREKFRFETGREPKLKELAERLHETEQELVLALQASSPPLSLSVKTEEGEPDDGSGQTLDLPVPSNEDALLWRLSLEEALSRLSEEDRALIRLRYRAGLSQQKTAEALSMTQVQVSRRERRILARLREELEE